VHCRGSALRIASRNRVEYLSVGFADRHTTRKRVFNAQYATVSNPFQRTDEICEQRVDADQAYLGEHVLTSAVKKVDIAVFKTIENAKNGTHRGGKNTVFTLSNDGVGLGTVNALVPESIVREVGDVATGIKTGAVTVPTTVGP
jgi:hypothetical protein